jgi:cytochrome c-type biogenesis protein CcmH
VIALLFALGLALAEAPAPLDEPPAGEPLSGPLLEQRTHEVSMVLRCPVCQGQSVADSNADASLAMRDRVRELVAQGYSDEQIVGYFVDRYGEWIRLTPPEEGINALVWVAPGLATLVGAALVVSRLMNRPEAPAPAAAPSTSGDVYRDRVLAELGERER